MKIFCKKSIDLSLLCNFIKKCSQIEWLKIHLNGHINYLKSGVLLDIFDNKFIDHSLDIIFLNIKQLEIDVATEILY